MQTPLVYVPKGYLRLPPSRQAENRVLQGSKLRARCGRKLFPPPIAKMPPSQLQETLQRKDCQWIRTKSDFFRQLSSSRDQPRENNDNNARKLVTATVIVERTRMLAFIDLGSDCNYITQEAALRAGLQPSWKKKPYSLYVANRQTMPRSFIINQEIHTTLHI
jgi:hypothetical protein